MSKTKNRIQKLISFVRNERGSAGYVVAAIGVMVVVVVLAFVTTIISTYIRFEAISTEIEQKMNNSAAVIASVYEDELSSYKRLAESNEDGYVGISNAEIYDTFFEDFSKTFSYESQDYTISNPAISLGCSVEDGFGITYTFTAQLTVRIILFNKAVGEITQDINLGASHNNMYVVDGATSDGDLVTVPAGVDNAWETEYRNYTSPPDIDTEETDATLAFEVRQ